MKTNKDFRLSSSLPFFLLIKMNVCLPFRIKLALFWLLERPVNQQALSNLCSWVFPTIPLKAHVPSSSVLLLSFGCRFFASCRTPLAKLYSFRSLCRLHRHQLTTDAPGLRVTQTNEFLLTLYDQLNSTLLITMR